MLGFKNPLGQLGELKEKLKKSKEELEASEFNSTSSSGMIKLTLKGNLEITKLTIHSDALKQDTKQLEDEITSAFNQSIEKFKAAQKSSSALSDIQKNLGKLF